MKKFLKKTIIIFFIFLNSSYAEVYFKVRYKINKNDTFAKILYKYLKSNSIIRKKTPMVIKTVKSNPHIKNWKKLQRNQMVNLYLSPRYIDGQKLQGKFLKRWLKYLNRKGRIKEKRSLIFSYLPSIGTFIQENDSTSRIIYNQNSILSLGASLAHFFYYKNISFHSSFYFSSFLPVEENLNKTSYQTDPETGLNFYGSYKFKKAPYLSFYSGFDFDRFYTFNQNLILKLKKLEMNANNIFYFTIGLNISFRLLKKRTLAKLSFSNSFFGFKNEYPDIYSGYRILTFISHPITKNISLNTLFKYHHMIGQDKLSVIRFGLGISYKFR